MSEWISVDDSLPPDETPVLVVYKGQPRIQHRIGELRWDHPGYEDSYRSYRYWDDPIDDGQCWEWDDITHWMPLPSLPEQKQQSEQNDEQEDKTLRAEHTWP